MNPRLYSMMTLGLAFACLLPACTRTLSVEPNSLPDIIHEQRSGKNSWINARDSKGKQVQLRGPIESIRIIPTKIEKEDEFVAGRWESLAIIPPGDAPVGVRQDDHTLYTTLITDASPPGLQQIPPREEATLLLRRKVGAPLYSIPMSQIKRVEVDYDLTPTTRKIGIILASTSVLPMGLGTLIFFGCGKDSILDCELIGAFVGGAGVVEAAVGGVLLLVSIFATEPEVREVPASTSKPQSRWLVGPGGVGLAF